jgi:dTDP-4-amino-4,6-dideoxygalactose transaminase
MELQRNILEQQRKKMINRMFDYQLSLEAEKEFFESCKHIIDEGFLTDHTYCRKLEDEIINLYRPLSCITVSSATNGIFNLLCSIPKDSSVMIQANTFAATGQAALSAGLRPKFFDIQNKLSCASYDSFVEKYEELERKGDSPQAAVIVSINGFESEESSEIIKFCKRKNVIIIYDSAQAFGAKFKNKFVGSDANSAVLSLHLTKVLAGGEGGMVMHFQNENRLLIESKKSKYFGLSEGETIFRGSNGKLSEFPAALAYVTLKHDYQSRVTRRSDINDYYKKNINNSYLQPQIVHDDNVQSYYKSVWLLENEDKRNNFEQYCKHNNIQLTGKVYPTPLSDHELFKTYDDFNAINSRNFGVNHVCLPNFPELKDEALEKIVEIINKYS